MNKWPFGFCANVLMPENTRKKIIASEQRLAGERKDFLGLFTTMKLIDIYYESFKLHKMYSLGTPAYNNYSLENFVLI